eukprot:scaffold252535_cov18-Prasinocladus_malaysianus.AAC.1
MLGSFLNVSAASFTSFGWPAVIECIEKAPFLHVPSLLSSSGRAGERRAAGGAVRSQAGKLSSYEVVESLLHTKGLVINTAARDTAIA